MSTTPRETFFRKSSERTPPLILLLQAVSRRREDLRLDIFNEVQIRWAIETGLGPLFFQTTKSHPASPHHPLWPLLKSADLTAQAITADQMAAMEEIIDACAAEGQTLTLLKGISICEQHYPEPHLRLMCDIDFLVPDPFLPSIEPLLNGLGYRRKPKDPTNFYEDRSHSMSFSHPQKGIWVDIHRRLFSLKQTFGDDPVFQPENFKSSLCPSRFRGRKVNRLCDELQMIYTACHWAQKFQVLGAMTAMIDLVYLLGDAKKRLRWGVMLDALAGSAAAAPLYLILTYLDRYRLIGLPPQILRELALTQRSFANTGLKVAHAMIDQYIVGGKEFGRVSNLRNLQILWRTLLLPGPPMKNLMLVPWNLLPSRWRNPLRPLRR